MTIPASYRVARVDLDAELAAARVRVPRARVVRRGRRPAPRPPAPPAPHGLPWAAYDAGPLPAPVAESPRPASRPVQDRSYGATYARIERAAARGLWLAVMLAPAAALVYGVVRCW